MHYTLREPKTPHAVRRIPIPPKVALILRHWISFHRQSLFQLGIANPQHLLLLNRRGVLTRASSINTSYHQLQKHLGITPKYSTHTLRHTLASLMIGDKNVSINYISRYLGHASTMITEKYYIGLLPEQIEEFNNEALRVISE